MFDPFYKNQALLVKAIFTLSQEVPAAQDQPRDASAQDGGQEHPIKVQSIRRGQGSECQFMVNNMRRSGGSKNFVRSVSVQADENKCNV